MMTNLSPKNAEYFCCEKCLFKCCKKSEWERHLTTLKHKHTYIDLQNPPKNAEKTPKYVCDLCSKGYLFRQSLYNHKKKCTETVPKHNSSSITNNFI